MLSREEVEALLRQPKTERPATQEEKEQFFRKLEQLPLSAKVVEVLTKRDHVQLFVNTQNSRHYSFLLKDPEQPNTLSDSHFVILE